MMSPSFRNVGATVLSQDTAARNRRAGLLGLAVLFVAGLMLSGCNTTAGARAGRQGNGRCRHARCGCGQRQAVR